MYVVWVRFLICYDICSSTGISDCNLWLVELLFGNVMLIPHSVRFLFLQEFSTCFLFSISSGKILA